MSFLGRASNLSTRMAVAIRRAAAKTKAAKKAAGRPTQGSNDPRHDLMKKILFDNEPRSLPKMSAEDIERHETILRADKIYKMESSIKRRDERSRKFAAMEKAYLALEKMDQRLFEGACKKEATITFPRQMRVPTETPPTKIWDYLD